jgi:hypothetical protein
MATHERELTEPVDLCTPDGARLNPDARGWSRRPLHRANLHGRLGQNKRWDYWAVLAGDLVVSALYADLDAFGLADVYWADLATGETGGAATVVPSADVDLPDRPGTAPMQIDCDGFELAITDDGRGTRLAATWRERDGSAGRLDVFVELPRGHESLNVVIPWSEDRFNFTSKHQARPAAGELAVADRRWGIGASHGDGWGVLDVGRGRWPRQITWNWGGGAGRCGEHIVGLQVGGKWTAGSGFTENGVIVDGRLTKLGCELDWEYSWDQPMNPWRVVDPGGQLAMTLSPRFDKHTKTGDGEFSSETHQVFGTWSGVLRTDDGRQLDFVGLQGFAEEARQRW